MEATEAGFREKNTSGVVADHAVSKGNPADLILPNTGWKREKHE